LAEFSSSAGTAFSTATGTEVGMMGTPQTLVPGDLETCQCCSNLCGEVDKFQNYEDMSQENTEAFQGEMGHFPQTTKILAPCDTLNHFTF
jgi:hypothetical protein